MDIVFDITRPIVQQAVESFGLVDNAGIFRMHPDTGTHAEIREFTFPGQLTFYHFGHTKYKVPVHMKSVNPPDSDWFIIHINLSGRPQQKRVGDEEIEFHKYHPAGILVYGPGLEIETFFPPGTEAEVCGLHFSRQLLEDYFADELKGVDLERPLTYEDLDPDLESRLNDALEVMDHKASAHSRVLDFLSAFIKKLQKHAPVSQPARLLSPDYRNLLRVSGLLRDPANSDILSIDDLAAEAGMSVTKFKTTFKQVFGCAPMQFRNKIRLEYAREQLRKRRKTPVELSFELGYSHPSNFTSAYKKHFNTLPSSEGV